MKNERHSKSLKGFTLIEMLVATGIFTLIIVLSVGIFSRFVSLQEGAQQTQVLLESMRAGIEIMNRELRTGFGSTYAIADGAGRGVVFRNQDGVCVHYRWEDTALERAEVETGGTECSLGDFSGSEYAKLTGTKVVVQYARFDAMPAEEFAGSLESQGFVTVMLEAVTSRGVGLPLQLQNTIVSRQVVPYIER